MRITVQSIMNTFNVARDKVKQLDSKQLFIVDLPTGRVLVSYKTIVGAFTDNIWYLTRERYSVTTSRQLSWFASRTSFNVLRVDTL